jgi:hypothetical protein
MKSHYASAQFDRLLHLLGEIATLPRLHAASAGLEWVAFYHAAVGLKVSVPLNTAG